MSRNTRKRLERIEQKLAEIATQKLAKNCNCRKFTIAASVESFEAEVNRSCPVHGFRRLGEITTLNVTIVDKGNITERSQGVAELVHEYERRLARHRQQILDEDDSEDL